MNDAGELASGYSSRDLEIIETKARARGDVRVIRLVAEVRRLRAALRDMTRGPMLVSSHPHVRDALAQIRQALGEEADNG